MVDLKARPYYLSEEDCQWVKDTIANMSPEEKVGQLFFQLTASHDEEYLKELMGKISPWWMPLQSGSGKGDSGTESDPSEICKGSSIYRMQHRSRRRRRMCRWNTYWSWCEDRSYR